MGTALSHAVQTLRRGGLVVYPTDTLLGLGALASHRGAVGRLLSAKGRSPTQPISVCVSSTEEVERYAQRGDPADAILDATPVDLAKLIELNKPIATVRYEFKARDRELDVLLDAFERTIPAVAAR